MKDRQGVLRGKCTECNECNEYVKPTEGARCDYCDHVPTKHVEIIQLGACKCGECDEYLSEEEFSYTDCQYCGCRAADHKGAEKLRKKKPPSSAPVTPTASVLQSSHTPNIQSRPTTQVAGVCKLPGCTRSCYSEPGGKTHEFCGKTHAGKFKELQQASSSPIGMSLPPSASSSIPSFVPASQPLFFPSSQTFGGGFGLVPPTHSDSSKISGTAKMCSKCQKHTANPGHSICQACYTDNN